MQTITREQLKNYLLNLNRGAQPITVAALMDARLKKTGNHFGQVWKLSKVQGFTGADYEKSVNRQRERENSLPTFGAEERSWGERINPYLVVHNGEYYLVVQVSRALQKPLYLNSKGILSKEKIAHLLPASRKAVNQKLEKDVIYRNYKLSSITSIAIDGKRFAVRG